MPEAPALALVDPAKDVDGLTPTSAGLLAAGRPGLVPCTPLYAIGAFATTAANCAVRVIGSTWRAATMNLAMRRLCFSSP